MEMKPVRISAVTLREWGWTPGQIKLLGEADHVQRGTMRISRDGYRVGYASKWWNHDRVEAVRTSAEWQRLAERAAKRRSARVTA